MFSLLQSDHIFAINTSLPSSFWNNATDYSRDNVTSYLVISKMKLSLKAVDAQQTLRSLSQSNLCFLFTVVLICIDESRVSWYFRLLY